MAVKRKQKPNWDISTLLRIFPTVPCTTPNNVHAQNTRGKKREKEKKEKKQRLSIEIRSGERARSKAREEGRKALESIRSMVKHPLAAIYASFPSAIGNGRTRRFPSRTGNNTVAAATLQWWYFTGRASRKRRACLTSRCTQVHQRTRPWCTVHDAVRARRWEHDATPGVCTRRVRGRRYE